MNTAPPGPMAARLTAQLLSGPAATSVVQVVSQLLAVQAQDLRAARLAIRSRTTGLSATAVDAGLAAREFVVATLNRGTLHLVRAQDYWWLHQVSTPQLHTSNQRRLRAEGVSVQQAERGVAAITELLSDGEPHSRTEVRALLASIAVPTAGQGFAHILLAAALRGEVVRGPMLGSEQALVSPTRWLGAAPGPLEPDQVLAQLAQRYLVGHGPAQARDLARWAGVTLGAARRGLAAIQAELVVRPDGLVDLADRAPVAELPPPRLLGGFEPVLLGWTSRADIVGAHRTVITSNGLFRPFAMVRGRAVASWGLAAGLLKVQRLEPLAEQVEKQLVQEAHAVQRFLNLPTRAPNFTP